LCQLSARARLSGAGAREGAAAAAAAAHVRVQGQDVRERVEALDHGQRQLELHAAAADSLQRLVRLSHARSTSQEGFVLSVSSLAHPILLTG
jgi:hypothetical protein